jgi:hypothetical protein
MGDAAEPRLQRPGLILPQPRRGGVRRGGDSQNVNNHSATRQSIDAFLFTSKSVPGRAPRAGGYLMISPTTNHASVATPTLAAKTRGKNTTHLRWRHGAGDGSDLMLCI